MSTDYGIYCQTCKNTFIGDNSPSSYAQALLHNVSTLAIIDAHIQRLENPAQDGCFEISLTSYCMEKLIQGFVEWLRSHTSDCSLVVCDEYGGLYDATTGDRFNEVPIEHIYNFPVCCGRRSGSLMVKL